MRVYFKPFRGQNRKRYSRISVYNNGSRYFSIHVPSAYIFNDEYTKYSFFLNHTSLMHIFITATLISLYVNIHVPMFFIRNINI